MQGTITRGIGGFYTVEAEDGSINIVRAQAKLRHMKLTPKVGDRVEYTPGQMDEPGWLTLIHERRNELVRPPVSNIDLLIITVAAAHPDPDLMLVDKLLMAAVKSGLPVRLVVNKCDADPECARRIVEAYKNTGTDPIAVSALAGTNVDTLRASLAGKAYAVAGQSGIGKSTLINALNGFDLKTGVLSEKIERGKHTTRHVELLHGALGSMVFDTPGFSFWENELMPPEEIESLYPEFRPHLGMCRFTPCAHIAEPDCAVRKALEAGSISPERYERYKDIYAEMKERWAHRYD